MSNENGGKMNGEDCEAIVRHHEEVEKHLKAKAADEAERRMRERHAQAQAGEAKVEEPAAEQPQPSGEAPPPEQMTHNGKVVREHLAFWVYADGSYHIQGPTEDHMRFVGLLEVLRDLENRNWNQICTQVENHARQAAAQAATPQGKKGAMRRMFGSLGRAIQKGN